MSITNVYESPDALFGMMLDRELTLRGAQAVMTEVFTGRPALSPNERVGFVDRMKAEASAYGPTAEALVGVATNPFAWLLFLTEPTIAGSVARRTGKLLSARPEFSAWIRKNGTMLQAMGLEWTGSIMEGTGAGRVIEEVLHTQQRLERGLIDRIAEPLLRAEAGAARYAKARGLSENEAKRRLDIYEQALSELWYRGGAIDRETLRLDIVEGKIARSKVMRKEHVPRVQWTQRELEDELRAGGRWELFQVKQQEYQRRAQDLLGVDDLAAPLTKETIDRDKVARLYGQMLSGRDKPPEIAARLEGSDLGKFLRKVENMTGNPDAGFTTDDVIDALADHALLEFNKPGLYLPRNTGRAFRKANQADFTALSSVTDYDSVLPFPGSALDRTLPERIWADPVIDAIEDAFGDPNLGRKLREDSERLLRKAGVDDVVRIDEIDPELAFRRYMQGTGSAYSLYTATPSQAARQGYREAVAANERVLRDAKIRGNPDRFMQELIEPKRRWEMLGGASNADLLDEMVQRIPTTNPAHAQMKNVILPRLTGSFKREEMFGESFTNSLRSQVLSLTKSVPVFRDLARDRGPVGALVRGLDRFGELDTSRDAVRPTRAIADYLYNTHLGLNFGSVLANLTQPLITLTRLNADLPTMVSAYGYAISKTATYADELFKFLGSNGFKMTPGQHDEIKRRVFGNTMFEVAELGGTSRAMYTDEVSQEVLSLVGKKGQNGFRRVMNAFMGPFQTAEMMNRLVAAKWGQKMLGFSDEALEQSAAGREAVARLNRETQFGSSVMNSPTTFMNPRSLMSNPLVRQFLQFPVRMATTPFVVDARQAWPMGAPQSILGKTSEFLTGGPALNNFMRGVGFSAVGFEILKGFTGADFSRYGYLESSLALPGTVADPQDGPIPVPPALSIAADTLGWLTTGDQQLLMKTVPRLIPGGISLARVLNVSPQADMGFLDIQRTYADYQTPNEDGTYNVFDYQGRLMYRVDGLQLALQGAGLDPEGFRNEARPGLQARNVIGDERSYRQSLLLAEQANNFGKAQKIRDEFKQRYGYDLVVNNRHRDFFLRNQTMTREELALLQIPEATQVDLFRQARELEELREASARQPVRPSRPGDLADPGGAGGLEP